MYSGAEFRGENQQAGLKPIVKRLDPDSVAGKHQAFPGLIPESEGEHAVKLLKTSRPELLVCMDDHLGVASGLELVASGFELAPQLAKVVNLAIEDNVDGSIFVRDRLIPGHKVDDRQPPYTQVGAPVVVVAKTVWSTVTQQGGHCAQHRLTRLAVLLRTDDTTNPAHSQRSVGLGAGSAGRARGISRL
jgi:hypothetical protein